MADDKPKPTRVLATMSVAEILALADRLDRDPRLAARAIRALAKSFQRGDIVTLDGD